jgi:hypothetical protein
MSGSWTRMRRELAGGGELPETDRRAARAERRETTGGEGELAIV